MRRKKEDLEALNRRAIRMADRQERRHLKAVTAAPRLFDEAQANRELGPVVRCPHCGSVISG